MAPARAHEPAGGEAGILTAWWHAPDHGEWRWQLELSNCRHDRESAEGPASQT